MFNSHEVKNPVMNRALKDKWGVRTQADGTIAKSRFIEEDSSNDIIQGTLDSVRAFAANQDTERSADDFFLAEIGPVNITAGSVLVAGQRVKCGTGGKAIAFIDVDLINTEIATEDGVQFTNQPATDTVDVESDSASDITQIVTLYGIDSSDDYISEALTLTGTSPVSTGSAVWKAVCGILIDAACVGTMKVTENSGGLTIKSIAAGTVTAGIEAITSGYAYNKKATIVADNAETGLVILTHNATDGASSTNLVAQMNGATEVELSVVSYKINTWMVGNVASTNNLDLDVTATEDNLKLAVGRVLTGAAVDAEAVILI